MHRRDFSRSLFAASASTLGAATGLVALPAQAQIESLKLGTEYTKLEREAPVDSPKGQIEVVEFFSYGCVHCFRFEPLLSDWMKKQSKDVAVRRTPIAFNPALQPLQQLYFALEAMGQVEALHEKAFQAIHVDQIRLQKEETIIDWAVKQGLDKTKFTDTFKSFGVAGKVKRATQLMTAYSVEGTPALGVAGRYYIPGQGPRSLQVADVLIAAVRKG